MTKRVYQLQWLNYMKSYRVFDESDRDLTLAYLKDHDDIMSYIRSNNCILVLVDDER